MRKKKTILEVVELMGGVTKCAKRLDVDPAAVIKWLQYKNFPAARSLVLLDKHAGAAGLDVIGEAKDFLNENKGKSHKRGVKVSKRK